MTRPVEPIERCPRCGYWKYIGRTCKTCTLLDNAPNR
jgi:ribosomal protein L32